MRPYLKGLGEPVHQSVNNRNKSYVSAGDEFPGAGLDVTVEEHGCCAVRGLL